MPFCAKKKKIPTLRKKCPVPLTRGYRLSTYGRADRLSCAKIWVQIWLCYVARHSGTTYSTVLGILDPTTILALDGLGKKESAGPHTEK